MLVLKSSVLFVLLSEAFSDPHPKGCAEDEIWISSQDWWLHDTDPTKDFGHLHTELCFPHMATISGSMTLDVTTIMHDNPGFFERVVIQIWNRSGDFEGCSGSSSVGCAFFDPPRTIATCVESGGELLPHNTCKWTDSLVLDTTQVPWDGYQQWRVRSMVDIINDEGLVEEMRTSTGLHAYLENGNPVSYVYEHPTVVEGRGWYTNANYVVSNLKEIPFDPDLGEALPVSGRWAPWVEMKPGSGGIPVVEHRVALDPAIHGGVLGTTITEGSGEFRGRVEIDTTTLSNGWHKLFLRSTQFEPIAGANHSNVVVFMFEVQNFDFSVSPPLGPSSLCSFNHTEPAVADTYVRGGGYSSNNYGSEDTIRVKWSSGEEYKRWSFMKFDLNHLPQGTILDSAELNLAIDDRQNPGDGTFVTVGLYGTSDNSWQENTITWDNKPTVDSSSFTTTVTPDDATDDHSPVVFDIVDYLNDFVLTETDRLFSFAMKDDSQANLQIRFESREERWNPPNLTFALSPSACQSPVTPAPTATPAGQPSSAPTAFPTNHVTPSQAPITAMPTLYPTASPTKPPTAAPTATPTAPPSKGPTDPPSKRPTAQPTAPCFAPGYGVPCDSNTNCCSGAGRCTNGKKSQRACTGDFWTSRP